MPKGQAPYVPNMRKLKALGRELLETGRVDPGLSDEMIRDRRVPERDPATQRFKSLYVDKSGFQDNRKKK